MAFLEIEFCTTCFVFLVRTVFNLRHNEEYLWPRSNFPICYFCRGKTLLFHKCCSKLYLMLTKHFSFSQTDWQTGRMKERACFQRQARAYCSFLMGQKETVPCRVVVFIQPDLGLWCFSFVICVLDELHLIESLGNVLLELLKLFCSIYCFSLTKNIIQNLVSCPPRQHF